MTEGKLVSILIPAYNAERYIAESLRSATSQTYRDIEIIIVDDGSTDKTKETILSLSDPRVRFFSQENKGIAKTRNRLLKEAKGDYVTFLDSDDIYLSDKVEKEARFLDSRPDYFAVYSDLRYFFDGAPNKFYKHKYTFPSGDIFSELLRKQFITNTTLMFRRAVVDKIGYFDENTREVEDWNYFLKMARAGMLFGFIDEVLVHFRLRWDNNTRFDKQVKIQADAVDIFENLKKELSQEERVRYGLDSIIAKRKMRLIAMFLAFGLRREALRTTRSIDFFILKIFLSVAVIILLLLPSRFLRFLIEKSWNLKKKNLFIPV